MFYLKIAWHNLKHSIDQYIPFLLASLLLYSLTCSTLLILMSAVGRDMGTAATVLFLGVIVLSIFAVVMEHYSYNILMKQRSSEFGLYNILGMNKRQVARVASLELFIIYIFLISIGSLFSAFFAKFIYLIFVNIINYHALNLSLSLWPFIVCIVIFTGIFLTLEVPVIRHVHLSSPLSLFRKKQQGEKEPKGNLILAILALVAIAIAYTMALTSGKAPALAVIYRFFFAVLLVIAGTYLFYISFMTWYLKRLRQNKHYYYKSEHFVSTSQMIFRMKQNAVGLASITLLAVMALVTIATTVSLYSNTQNVVTGLFPKSVSLSIDNSKGDAKNIFEEKILKKLGKSSKEAITYNQTMISMPVSQSSELNITSKNVKHVDITKTGFMYLITQNDFRRLGHRLPKLKDNQVAYFVQKGDSRLKKINLLGNKFDVVKNLKEAYVPETTNTYNPGLIIFANNKQIDNIRKAYLPYTKNINTFPKTFKAYLDLNSQEINSISKNDIIEVDGKYVGNISTKQSFLKEGYQMFGGLLFTGFLLGISFLLGIALIVYYKQYSEGHEDKRSYRILQEVGMSKKLVKRTINSQIMIFFFQPLVVAVIHFGVAIPMLKQMLLVFGVLNSTIVYVVSGLTVLAISIIYFIIYRITSRTYYHIIER
ncbi:TPA: FtsX-like permease family protein [Streptococcus agalactiae]